MSRTRVTFTRQIARFCRVGKKGHDTACRVPGTATVTLSAGSGKQDHAHSIAKSNTYAFIYGVFAYLYYSAPEVPPKFAPHLSRSFTVVPRPLQRVGVPMTPKASFNLVQLKYGPYIAKLLR